VLVVATLDEMFITTFLYRQAHTIITEAHTSVFIHRLALEGGLHFLLQN